VKPLFEVQDVFLVTGRGIILIPGLSETNSVREGSEVVLQRPDNTRIITKILSFELVSPKAPPGKNRYPIVIPDNIGIFKVPIGTKVFLKE